MLGDLDELVTSAASVRQPLEAWARSRTAHRRRRPARRRPQRHHQGGLRPGQHLLARRPCGLRAAPEVCTGWVRFTQTAGGVVATPTPRRVRHQPYVQIAPSIPWTTLSLTIHADGSSEPRLVGASPFPRHWVYDHGGRLVAKSGFIDYDAWWREAFGSHTPWGDEDSAPIVTAVESALERQLSVAVVDARPRFRRLQAGRTLVRQGEPGDELFLLFDGMLDVERDGAKIAEVGPGAVLGEMALLEGRRTPPCGR